MERLNLRCTCTFAVGCVSSCWISSLTCLLTLSLADCMESKLCQYLYTFTIKYRFNDFHSYTAFHRNYVHKDFVQMTSVWVMVLYISLWGGMTKYLHFTTRIPRYIVYGYHCYGVGILIAFKIFNYFWFPRGGDLMTPSSHDLCIIWWAMTLEQRYVYSLWMGILTLLINSGPWGEGMLSNHPKNTVIPRVHDRVWH